VALRESELDEGSLCHLDRAVGSRSRPPIVFGYGEEALAAARVRDKFSTRVAALLCSLIESVKLRSYLNEVTVRAIRSAGTVALSSDLKQLEYKGNSPSRHPDMLWVGRYNYVVS
jgi:hypothetical protein